MAVLANQCASLYDMQVMMNPSGGYVNDVIEALNKKHEFIRFMQFIRGNETSGHKSTIRVGLPEAYLTEFYGYVPSSKSEEMQVVDTCGTITAYSGIDVDLYELSADTEAGRLKYRARKEAAFIEAINQELSRLVFHGNPKIDRKEFSGLTPRFNDTSAENGENIFDAGGTGANNASIWLIGWGDMSVHGILPRGATSGIQHDNLGKQVETITENGVTKNRTLLKSRYTLKGGLAVPDWRYVVRICNIDKTQLTDVYATGSAGGKFLTGANLPRLMKKALNWIHSVSDVTPVFCMSREIKDMLEAQCSSATQGATLSTENVGGIDVDTFRKVPVLRTDILATDEARVT